MPGTEVGSGDTVMERIDKGGEMSLIPISCCCKGLLWGPEWKQEGKVGGSYRGQVGKIVVAQEEMVGASWVGIHFEVELIEFADVSNVGSEVMSSL